MKLAEKAHLRVAVLVVTLVGALSLVFAPALVSPAQALQTKTGQYTGNGTTTQVNTGMAALKSLRIVQVRSHGMSSQAYTTNAIQSSLGSGVFLNGDMKDQGIALGPADFTVTNLDFNLPGVLYHWDANGD